MRPKHVDTPLLPALYSKLRRRLKARTYQMVDADRSEARQLLVDVSVIIRQDARTGIQRVVRAVLGQLIATVGPHLTIQPVFASRDHGYCRATFEGDGRVTNSSRQVNVLQPITIQRGDIFLGLDLAANILPYAEVDLARWRREGVAINIMIYDLLPLYCPEWFPRRTSRNFKRWLGAVARQADCCICISDVVATELAQALATRCHGRLPRIATIPLGADLTSSYPSRGFPSDAPRLREWLQHHKVLLTVGTIEPRKGHDRLLAAMTEIWHSRPDSNLALLLVGRPGWKTGALQGTLRRHPEFGRRLLWLEDVSDEFLSEIYANAAGVVLASRGEGFGLPLREALAQGVPVLARDLPVFREIGGALLDYFDDDNAASLASRISEWMSNTRAPEPNAVKALPRWADSVAVLTEHIGMSDEFQFDGCPV